MSRQVHSNARGLGLLLVLVVGLAFFWRFSGGGRGMRGAGSAGGSVEASRESVMVDEPAGGPPSLVPPRNERALERSTVGTRGPGPGQLAMRVTVRDLLDQRAIAGARVQAIEKVTEGAAPETRTTDEQGECALFVRDSRASLRVRVEAAGYVHATWELGREQPIQIDLQRATRLVGCVRDQASGAPVAGARLRYTHSNCSDCGPDEDLSGPDGRFVLPEVPRLDYAYLSVEAEGFVPLEDREFLLRTDATEVEQDVHLVRGVEVRGRVLDWSTRTGIAGARVGGLVADAEGRFAGRWQPEPGGSQVRLEVSAADHATLETSVELEGELEFVLPRLVTLSGRALDSAGAPVAGVRVLVNGHGPARDEAGTPVETSPLYELPKGSQYEAPSWGEETDETGAFRLTVLPWCLNLELAAHASGFLPASRTLRRLGEPGSETSADLVLEPELGGQTWLSGNVLLNGSWSGALTGSIRWRGPTRGGEARFQKSRYELAVEPGEVALAFTLDAVPGELAGAELTVRARDGARLERQVELRAREATITGRTRFEDGTPSPFVYVGAEAEDGLVSSETWSDERGEFALAVADIGRSFQLEAESYDLSAKADDVAAGASGVELVFPRRYPLLVRFRDGDSGAPLRLGQHVRLLARCGPEGFRDVEFEESTPDLDGWIEGWLAAPRVDLLAFTQKSELAAFGRRLVRDVALTAADGRAARIEIVLQRVVPLVLELDSRGEPLPEELEHLWLVEDELADGFPRTTGGRADKQGLLSRRSVTFDEHGRAELPGYAPGRYRFLVDPPDIAIDPADVLVEPGGGLPVPVRWRRVR